MDGSGHYWSVVDSSDSWSSVSQPNTVGCNGWGSVRETYSIGRNGWSVVHSGNSRGSHTVGSDGWSHAVRGVASDSRGGGVCGIRWRSMDSGHGWSSMGYGRHGWSGVISRHSTGHGWRSGDGAAESAVAVTKASVTIAKTTVADTAVTKTRASEPGVTIAMTQGVAAVATQSASIASIAVSESCISEQGATDIASCSAGDQGQE